MTNLKTALLYGMLIWLVVMTVAMVAFPLRAGERPLFESIMPVALTAMVVVCAAYYFGHVGERYVREGLLLGLVWFGVNFAMDQIAFSFGPMRMSFAEYCKDIGLTYLLIPAVTAGYGWVLESHRAPASPT